MRLKACPDNASPAFTTGAFLDRNSPLRDCSVNPRPLLSFMRCVNLYVRMITLVNNVSFGVVHGCMHRPHGVVTKQFVDLSLSDKNSREGVPPHAKKRAAFDRQQPGKTGDVILQFLRSWSDGNLVHDSRAVVGSCGTPSLATIHGRVCRNAAKHSDLCGVREGSLECMERARRWLRPPYAPEQNDQSHREGVKT